MSSTPTDHAPCCDTPGSSGTPGTPETPGTCKRYGDIFRGLDRLDAAIRGNGQPGINVRLDRLERDARRHSRILWLIAGAATAALASGVTAWLLGGGLAR